MYFGFRLCKEAFDANRGLFVTTKDQLLYPNTLRYAQEGKNMKRLFISHEFVNLTSRLIFGPFLQNNN